MLDPAYYSPPAWLLTILRGLIRIGRVMVVTVAALWIIAALNGYEPLAEAIVSAGMDLVAVVLAGAVLRRL